MTFADVTQKITEAPCPNSRLRAASRTSEGPTFEILTGLFTKRLIGQRDSLHCEGSLPHGRHLPCWASRSRRICPMIRIVTSALFSILILSGISFAQAQAAQPKA